jgi:hypothetical protein
LLNSTRRRQRSTQGETTNCWSVRRFKTGSPIGHGFGDAAAQLSDQDLELLQLRPFRSFRDPAEVASIAGLLNEKLIERLDGRLLQAPAAN